MSEAPQSMARALRLLWQHAYRRAIPANPSFFLSLLGKRVGNSSPLVTLVEPDFLPLGKIQEGLSHWIPGTRPVGAMGKVAAFGL